MKSVSVTVKKPEVKSRPIIFDAPSIRAILDGMKTQMRHVVTPQPSGPGPSHWYFDEKDRWWTCGNNAGQTWRCPYGSVGERLWVRETWHPKSNAGAFNEDDGSITITYPADGASVYIDDYGNRIPEDWTIPKGAARGSLPPRSMPQWASRITLEITGVKVERLWQIAEADVLSEGIGAEHLEKNRKFFHKNDDGRRKGCAWKDNCWVWVVSFKVLPLEIEARA